ncbi:MAG: iron ABC transporter permease [Candidatus Omnitrophica bacterium]|nr:iron ABC transporter permease [Candidatus Omnitrophota bacterium]
MKKIIFLLVTAIFIVIALLPFCFLIIKALSENPRLLLDLGQLCFNARTGQLIFNSISIGLGATILGVILGVPLGFLISRTNIFLKGAAQYLVFLPVLIPEYIAAMAWSSMFPAISNPWGVIWVLGLAYCPFVCLLTIAGLSTIDRKLEEQALLVTHPLNVIKRITIPLITPFMVTGALFVFIFSIANYGVPALLRVNTYPLEIFIQFSALYNSNLAVLSCLPLLLITMGLMIICYFVMKDKFYISFEGISSSAAKIQLKKSRIWFSIFVWLIIFVSGILPLIILIKTAGSFDSYLAVLKTSTPAIWTSFGLSTLGATLCVILGFYLAYFLERVSAKGKIILDIATLLPLALPPVVLGIGLIELWNQPTTSCIYSSFLIVIIGLIARFIPFSVRILASCFKQLNPNMEDAASLNGIGFFRETFQILLPLTKQGLAASWAICFIFCMGELGMTLLVVPPGYETLGNKIYTLLHYGVGKFTAALSVVQIVVTIIPVILILVLSKIWGSSHDRIK